MSNIWMPLYVADYLSKTGHLSTIEHGAYLLLIMQYWTQGGLPDNDKILAQITRLRIERWRTVRPQLEPFFTLQLGKQWKHDRIDRELEKSADLREKRQSAAAVRWSNSNANALQMHTQPQSLPPEERKILSFTGGGGGRSRVEMTPENRLSLFHNWLAPLLGPDGWTFIREAMDPAGANYTAAVSHCRTTARKNGKGWPHQWPK